VEQGIEDCSQKEEGSKLGVFTNVGGVKKMWKNVNATVTLMRLRVPRAPRHEKRRGAKTRGQWKRIGLKGNGRQGLGDLLKRRGLTRKGVVHLLLWENLESGRENIRCERGKKTRAEGFNSWENEFLRKGRESRSL